MPPLTPRTMREPRTPVRATRLRVGPAGRGVGGGGLRGGRLGGGDLGQLLLGGERHRLDLADLDLLHGDGERLARHRGDLRRDDLAEALAELVVVVVDLAGPHRRQRDQRELGVDPLRAATPCGGSSGSRAGPCRQSFERVVGSSARSRGEEPARIPATSATTRSRSSFTTTWSNSDAWASSAAAAARRRSRASGVSVPRLTRRRRSSSPRGRHQEDQHRRLLQALDLQGALHVDLEQHVPARRRGAPRPVGGACPSGRRRPRTTRRSPRRRARPRTAPWSRTRSRRRRPRPGGGRGSSRRPTTRGWGRLDCNRFDDRALADPGGSGEHEEHVS